METAPVSLPAYAALLRGNKTFRRLWLAQLVSELGDWLYTVSIYSLIFQITGSAQAVAFAFVLQVFPQTLAAPAAGVLNDRVSRKRLMIVADWARAVIVILMLLVRTREDFLLLFVLLFLETVFWALFEPARTAVIPNITGGGRETLVANALSATTWSFTLAAGAGVGGVLAALFGRDFVFVLNAVSFVISALLIRSIHIPEPHLEHVAPFQARDLLGFEPIREGILYVGRDSRLLATMFVKAGMGLMATNWILIPLLGEKVFPVRLGGMAKEAGMLGMSLLFGARGLGALIGPFVAARWTGHDEPRFRQGIFWAFGVSCLGYVVVGFAPSLPVAIAGVFIAHSGSSVAWVFS
ncbi:MAG TPA: MFS transporter, partial [Bryobacteraceae bacterium]|nr:MFS transporter [Bryobacteraceae bacterium]